MSLIQYQNGWVYLTDGYNQKTAILKVYDPLGNYSSLPMYESEGGKRYPIFDLLTTISGDYIHLSSGVTGGLDKTEVHLCLILIAKALMKKHRDYSVLELGCDNGVLSASLAPLLKGFNPGNRLVCVTERLDRAAGWVDKVSLSGAADIASLVAAPCASAPLPRDRFDIVVINGSAPFEDPADIVWRSIGLAKNNGLILCVSSSQFLLTSSIQVIAENCHEYYLGSASSVLACPVGTKDKYVAYKRTDEYKRNLRKQEIIGAIGSLKKFIAGLPQLPAGDPALDAAIQTVMRAEDGVLAVFGDLTSVDIKYCVNVLKEYLIRLRLSQDEAERARYAVECGEKYQAVLSEMRKYGDFVL